MERLTSNKNVSDMSMIELAHNSCYADDERNARYRDYEMDMDARDFARNLMVTLTKDELPISDTEFDVEILDDLAIDPFSDVRGLIALFYRNLWAMANLRETLKKYEDLEERLNKVYGDCDGLLESMIELLEEHSGVDIPDDTVKALLLTNKAVDFYKECEDLDVQDRLIKLPCKVGDDVWFVPSQTCYKLNILNGHGEANKVYHQKVARITFDENGWYMVCDKDLEYAIVNTLIGKMFNETWFLTQSEAEAKLKELRGGDND